MGLISAAALSLAALAATAQPPTPAPPAPKPAARASAPPAIATVGTRRIARQDFDARALASMRQYRERAGSDVPEEFKPTVRRQVLENLIRRELLVLEATRRGTLGSEAEAEAEMKKDVIFNPGGSFDPARFEAIRTTQPEAFANARRLMREQIGVRRLSQKLESDYQPSQEEARAAAERIMSTSEVSFLGLATEDFVGSYNEPRETEVIEAYRRGGESFRRPARAVLSVIPVETTGGETGAALDARRAALRERADSLAVALRQGVPLDDAGVPFGGVQRGVVVNRASFPGYWAGEPRDADAVFAARPGDILGPVRARAGWLVVRVEEARPAQIAPLTEVSREIRNRLRGEALEQGDQRRLRALYDEIGGALRGPALRVRWAWVDTTRLTVPAPGAADLERFLKAHLAEYSYFDEKTASVRARPLAEVEPDVRRRWLAEKREELSRSTLDQIARAWDRKSRDAAAERRATGVREAGPLPPGARLEDTPAARAVADSLRGRGTRLGLGAGRYPQGRMVFQVFEVVQDHRPTFEQAVPQLRQRLAERVREEEDRGARALFDRDPAAFARGELVRFTRALVMPLDILKVPLSREEVERHHRENIDRYSAPEEVVASHILIRSEAPAGSPADAAARTRAEGLLAQVRRGESFARLAQQHSDDAATRANGGALGTVASAEIPDAVEMAAIGARAGDAVGPVRSEAGYHLVQVTERLPMVAHPLPTLWTVVGQEAARQKADRIIAARADSVLAAGRTPDDYRAIAKKLGLAVQTVEFEKEDTGRSAEMRPVLKAIAKLKPGEVLPHAFRLPGMGYGVAWVESVEPPRAPRWESARDRAGLLYREGASRRALDRKRAELDSLLAQGWTLDSLGTLWGGLEKLAHRRGGAGLPRLGGSGILDSLVLGGSRPAALEPGQASGWVEFPQGLARVRFDGRTVPEPGQVAARAESNRRAILERRLADFYADLMSRWPVRILDAKLAQVPLPPVPEPL